MKISKQPVEKPSNGKSNRKGVALILVLTVMSLATIMILTFFSMAKNENKASATYSRGLQAEQIAEQAVNVVIAQIRLATKDASYTWASQPGAIRTWSTSSGESNSFKGYKLYSDDKILETDETKLVDEDFADAQTWEKRPDEFVDLNEPVIRGEKVYFPIVDPSARDLPEWPKRSGGEEDDRGVEGFDFNFGNLKISSDHINAAVAERNGVGHLPLPVKWIYQLEDGTLGTLRAGNFEPLSPEIDSLGIDENNQIVARFAWWADDESSKLNVNTHAGGVAWDTPRAGGDFDLDLGRHQPARHEWQRYPGHPATTHLAPVLAPGILDIVRNKSAMEIIYSMVPRIVQGGSESGTRKIDLSNPRERNGLIADTNPLYPSVDELIMAPDRNLNVFPQADGRPVPKDKIQETMERVRFFLTTNSRSPETTMFNTPRVCVWPVHDSEPDDEDYELKYTEFDKLIRFCCRVGVDERGKACEYIFRRKNADSATSDYQDIENNKVLYAYLDSMTSKNIPWAGSSFASKYPDDRYQILTQIFDYIRCTNLHDDTLFRNDWKKAFATANSSTHRTFTNPRKRHPGNNTEENQREVFPGHGQVTPIRINYKSIDTMGFGRFYTLSEVAVMAITLAQGPGNNPSPAELFGGTSAGPLWPGFKDLSGNSAKPSPEQAYSNFPPMHFDLKELTGENGNSTLPVEELYPLLARYDDYPGWLTKWLDDNYNSVFRPMGNPDWKQVIEKRNEAPDGVLDWKHYTDLIYPAFDINQWNFNLLYRLEEFPELDRNDDPVKRTYFFEDLSKVERLALINRNDSGNYLVRLEPGERMIQAALIFSMFCPASGWAPVNPDLSLEIDLNPETSPHYSASAFTFNTIDQIKGSDRGRFLSDYDIFGKKLNNKVHDLRKAWSANSFQSAGGLLSFNSVLKGFCPLDPGYSQIPPINQYHWVTPPFAIDGTVIQMKGGEINFKIYAGGANNQNSAPQSGVELVQNISVKFPDLTKVLVPILTRASAGGVKRDQDTGEILLDENGMVKTGRATPAADGWSLSRESGNPLYNENKYGTDFGIYLHNNANLGNSGRLTQTAHYLRGNDMVQSIGIMHGDARIVAATHKIESNSDQKDTNEISEMRYFGPHFNFDNAEDLEYNHDNRTSPAGGRVARGSSKEEYSLVQKINYNNKEPAGPIGLPALDEEPDKYFRKNVQLYGDFDNGAGLIVDGPYINKPDEGNANTLFNGSNGWGSTSVETIPYFVGGHETVSPAYFSPNRITSGPGMFGSLPTGVTSNVPWRTLLFRPNCFDPSFEYQSHPGAVEPKDHYLLDLFWMPVVEPYAISDPLSTAGKINLNYQILPFRHIKRESAVRGVFRSEYMLCVPTPSNGKPEDANIDKRSIYTKQYKHHEGRGEGYDPIKKPNGGFLQGKRLRTVILEHETLKQFQKKFDTDKQLFRTASEICDIHLVPQQAAERMGLTTSRNGLITYTPKEKDGTFPDMDSGMYWVDHVVVGDNSRERPYGNIYSRITTKSNTFRVHFRAEVIKQGRRSDSNSSYSKYDPELDTTVSTYRGSSLVERYIDPNDSSIPHYAREDSMSNKLPAIGEFYRFRVINISRFAP